MKSCDGLYFTGSILLPSFFCDQWVPWVMEWEYSGFGARNKNTGCLGAKKINTLSWMSLYLVSLITWYKSTVTTIQSFMKHLLKVHYVLIPEDKVSKIWDLPNTDWVCNWSSYIYCFIYYMRKWCISILEILFYKPVYAIPKNFKKF